MSFNDRLRERRAALTALTQCYGPDVLVCPVGDHALGRRWRAVPRCPEYCGEHGVEGFSAAAALAEIDRALAFVGRASDGGGAAE